MRGPVPSPCQALALYLLSAVGGNLQAQERPPRAGPPLSPESRAAQLRATMILRVASYIQPTTAPAKKPAPLTIGVVGDDPTARWLLQQMNGQRFGDRDLVVRSVAATDVTVPERTDAMVLLYLAADVDAATVTRLTAACADRPLALLCERPGFVAAGGTVQLFVRDNFLRFEINSEAMKRQGLVPDSQLQKLSQRGPR
jgi:YfiR/HmsC-like